MLDSLNEIDPVAFYTSSEAISLSKLHTSSPVNIFQDNPLNSMSMLDINNPTPSPQLGQSDMLSDHLFEEDLPEIKTYESNILDAFENMVIGSLILMREQVLHEWDGHLVEETLEGSQPAFDKTPNFSE